MLLHAQARGLQYAGIPIVSRRPVGPLMEKIMCYAAIGIGALMALIFLMDIVAGMPFGGGSFAVPDFLGLIASGVVAYMGLNALKEAK